MSPVRLVTIRTSLCLRITRSASTAPLILAKGPDRRSPPVISHLTVGQSRCRRPTLRIRADVALSVHDHRRLQLDAAAGRAAGRSGPAPPGGAGDPLRGARAVVGAARLARPPRLAAWLRRLGAPDQPSGPADRDR